LFEGASPFTKNAEGKRAIDLVKTQEIKELVKRAESLHIINATDNKNAFLKRIKTGLRFFFEDVEKK